MERQNMHIHSKYSWDSKMEIEEIAKILSKNGIKYGAITDHIEFDREPIPYILTKLKIRNLKIDRINEIYEGKLILLKAAEISEPHLYIDKVKQLEELELDFLMGSLHNFNLEAKTDIEKTRTTYFYYRELLKMVEANQVDVIGHIDYINRKYKKDYSQLSQVLELIKAINERNIIIELNTSAKRRANLNIFPDAIKVCNYKVTGGNDIIMGTDAHQYDELLDNLESAETLVNELNLKPVIFQKRKRINI